MCHHGRGDSRFELGKEREKVVDGKEERVLADCVQSLLRADLVDGVKEGSANVRLCSKGHEGGRLGALGLGGRVGQEGELMFSESARVGGDKLCSMWNERVVIVEDEVEIVERILYELSPEAVVEEVLVGGGLFGKEEVFAKE